MRSGALEVLQRLREGAWRQYGGVLVLTFRVGSFLVIVVPRRIKAGCVDGDR